MAKKILDGHKKVGTKFIPPAKYKLNLDELNWVDNLLPELIWLGVLNEELGVKKGIEIGSFFVKSAFEVSKTNRQLDFSFISSYKFLTSDELSQLIVKTKEKKYFDDLTNSLRAFVSLYPDNNPLNFLFPQKEEFDKSKSIIEFKKILEKNFYRRDKSAMLLQATVMYSLGLADKLFFLEHIEPPDLNAIFTEFDSDKAKRSAGAVRAFVSSTFGFISETIKDDWSRYFWDNGLQLENIDLDYLSDLDYSYSGEDKFYETSYEYQKKVDESVIKIWNQLPKSIYRNHTIEVLGALITRQATLAKRIARNPENWDFHIGPILLRAMIDIHITLAWILKDPEETSKKYIEYGLGQEKLQIEHLEDEVDDGNDKPLLDILIDARKAWLESQRFPFLTTVDIGSWSGHNTREMAEDSGCRNLYRFAYTPFSSCAHSMWNHVGKFNIRYSENPLHKHFRLPFDPDILPQPETLINSAKYLKKSLNLIIEKNNLHNDSFDPISFWEEFFIKNSKKE